MDLTTPATARVTPVIGGREATWVQAAILLVTSGLTVLVTAILGPSLPAMQAHFKDVPGADFLVPLTMSVPMLMMAGLSVFAGELADRFGRKRLLVGATALYGVVGIAPMLLDSLVAIIASRCALGVLEAVLMTISTTMIGDYYDGSRRERLMSLQTTVAATSAFLFNNLGGVIAEQGWRAPYSVFVVGLLLAPLMAAFLWEPGSRSTMTAQEMDQDREGFRPGIIVVVCLLAVLLGIVFLTVPVHFGYLYGAIGVQSPSQIGMAYGINSLGVISGTLLFGWVLAAKLKVGHQLACGTLLAGIGFLMMKQATDYGMLTAAGFVNGCGAGILLPTMVTWNMRELPLSRRGVGTGAFQSCLFFGMFVSPILIVGLEKALAVPRSHAIGLEGFVVLGLAVFALVAGLMQRARH